MHAEWHNNPFTALLIGPEKMKTLSSVSFDCGRTFMLKTCRFVQPCWSIVNVLKKGTRVIESHSQKQNPGEGMARMSTIYVID